MYKDEKIRDGITLIVFSFMHFDSTLMMAVFIALATPAACGSGRQAVRGTGAFTVYDAFRHIALTPILTIRH